VNRVPSNRQVWLIVAGLMLGMFLQGLDTLLVVTALPTIAGELGGLGRLSWVLSAYLLTLTASVPLYGKVGDLFGRTRPYQFAVVLFGVTSIFCAVAQDMNQLIIARALKGIGGGGLMVLPFAIVADIVPARSRARYQGVMGANMAVATLLGPLIGGFFVDHASWRIAFLVGVPPAVVALLASRRLRLPSRPLSWSRLDLAGAALVVAVSAVVLLGISGAGNSFSWWSPQAAGIAVLTIVLVAALIAVERRASDPVVPLGLLTDRPFAVLLVGTFVAGIAMFGPWVLMPIFLQLITGASATVAGLWLLPLIIAISVTSWLAGRRIAMTGNCKAIVVTGTVLASAGFCLYLLLDVDSSRLEAGVFMTVTGAGLGLLIQPAMTMGQGIVARDQIGVATASVAFCRQLGQAFGAAVVLSVFASRLAVALAEAGPPGLLSQLDEGVAEGDPVAVRALSDGVRQVVLPAYARALHAGFLSVIPFAVLSIVLAVMLPRVRLHDEERVDVVGGHVGTRTAS